MSITSEKSYLECRSKICLFLQVNATRRLKVNQINPGVHNLYHILSSKSMCFSVVETSKRLQFHW